MNNPVRSPSKSELNRAAEVCHDRLALIELSLLMVVIAIGIAAFVYAVCTGNTMHFRSDWSGVIIAVSFVFLVDAGGIAYYARSLYKSLRNREDYMVCPVYLSDPHSGGRGYLSFEAHITLPSGKRIGKRTRGVISVRWQNGYNGDANREGRLECAYDPMNDRLLILPTWEETVGFDM